MTIIEGLQNNIENLEEIEDIRHGTTIGVNTVIENKGSKTGLITTEGFRDLLEIGRQKRPAPEKGRRGERVSYLYA